MSCQSTQQVNTPYHYVVYAHSPTLNNSCMLNKEYKLSIEFKINTGCEYIFCKEALQEKRLGTSAGNSWVFKHEASESLSYYTTLL